jgi:nucleoside-diphosphate-sugar epimerase
VTGASGFIGVNLVRHLAESGFNVLGTTRQVGGVGHLVEDYLKEVDDLVKWINIDITESNKMINIATEYDLIGVIHAAVFTAVTKDVERERSRAILESNLLGTVNTLELARISEVCRYVYVSSSGLYGRSDNLQTPITESSQAPYLKMGGFYGITKITSEKLTERYNQLFPMETTSMRIAAPYGNMERPTNSRNIMGPIYRLLHLVITEDREIIRVKGLEYSRDFTFVMDTVRGLVAGLRTTKPISQIYNIASGTNYSLQEILVALQDVPGIDFEWIEVGSNDDADLSGNLRNQRAPLSIKKAEEELSFKPKYTLKTGIRAYCDWWRSVSTKGLMIS